MAYAHTQKINSGRAVNKGELLSSIALVLVSFVSLPLIVYFFSFLNETNERIAVGALALLAIAFAMSSGLMTFFRNFEIERRDIMQEVEHVI